MKSVKKTVFTFLISSVLMRSCQNCAHVELAEHDYVEMASGGWRCSICRHISNSIIKSRKTHYNNICK